MVDIIPIPAFQDNYIWCISDGRHAAVVDPGDAAPVLEFLQREHLTLTAILATHHHADHVGGIASLLEAYPVPVYGPGDGTIPQVTDPVAEGDEVMLAALEIALEILEIPGHTPGHIAYYGVNRLFCGDTLFACGCGRLFGGTPEQMTASLQRLAELPGGTLVYCAHEYTLANIRFARAVEPGNRALAERERADTRTREQKRPTVPSSIGREKATNPFLRCAEPEVAQSASRYRGAALAGPVEVFAAIREWKNGF